MQKLRVGKWVKDVATGAEFDKAVAEIKEVVEKYGWQKKRVAPYGHGIEIEKLVSGWNDYNRCTHSSKCILVREVNGLIDVLEKWIAVEEEPKVKVEMIIGNKVGTVAELPMSIAMDFIDMKWARVIA